jgi:hypothetical protein
MKSSQIHASAALLSPNIHRIGCCVDLRVMLHAMTHNIPCFARDRAPVDDPITCIQFDWALKALRDDIPYTG